MRVYKYPVKIQALIEIAMPRGSEVVHFGEDPPGQLCIWARVEPMEVERSYRFRIAGTGHNLGIADNWRHVASCISGPFVWHLFQEP